MNNKICFGVMAIGREYRFHARRLLNDLQTFGNGFSVIVLTDHPEEFKGHRNAEAIFFEPQGVLRRYHDKRFLLKAAFPRFSSCIIIDANIRVLEPLPLDFELGPGISALVCEKLTDHFEHDRLDIQAQSQRRFASLDRTEHVVFQAASKLGVEPTGIQFVYEFLYAVTNTGDSTSRFLAAWDVLAKYLDYHGLAWSEGYGIGLAASASGIPVRQQQFMDVNAFYKYRLHHRLVKRDLQLNPRVELCNRQYALLGEYARFTLVPRRWSEWGQRLLMGIRWAGFRMKHRNSNLLAALAALNSVQLKKSFP